MEKDDGDTTNELLKTWQMNRLKWNEENGWGGIIEVMKLSIWK